MSMRAMVLCALCALAVGCGGRDEPVDPVGDGGTGSAVDVVNAEDGVGAADVQSAPETSACALPQRMCGSSCVDLTNDAANCGGCGRSCPTDQVCAAGSCHDNYPSGQTSCGGSCRDTTTDGVNCGACGHACAASEQCVSGACARASGLRIDRWTPDGLMSSGSSFYFPTYVAHLLGGTSRHPALRPLACATLTNDATASRSATLTVSLPAYATAAVRAVTVPAGMTSTFCLTPSFQRPALTALTAPTAGSMEASATGDFITPPSSVNLPVTVLPLNNFLTQNSAVPYAGTLEPVLGIWLNGMLELLPVFATPTNPAITAFLPTVAAQSAYGGFGDSPYARSPISYGPASTGSAGAISAEAIYLEAGESLSIAPISVMGGDGSVSVALFDPAQYDAWIAGRGGTSAAFWSRRTAMSSPDTYTNRTSSDQTLVVVFAAPDTTPRTVRWFRTNTREDVASDALRSIYNALSARGTTYTSIAANYYLSAGGQRVRLPSETLATRTGNCIDGVLLFASLLELIGMEPVITTVQRPGAGHAYVGVRSAPGSHKVWSVETTMLGTAIYEQAALAAAEEATMDAANSSTRVYPIDVRAARLRGITPIP